MADTAITGWRPCPGWNFWDRWWDLQSQEHFDKESLVGKKLSVSWRWWCLKGDGAVSVCPKRTACFPEIRTYSPKLILSNNRSLNFWINVSDVSSALWSTPYTMMCQEHSSSDVTLCHSHFPKLCSSYSSPNRSAEAKMTQRTIILVRISCLGELWLVTKPVDMSDMSDIYRKKETFTWR